MLKVIEDRRSIRKFIDEKVSKEDILHLIEAASLAPSAKNRQHWYFVVTEGDIKNKIGDMVMNGGKVSSEYTGKAIHQAPTLILVFNSEEDRFAHQSIGAAIQNVLLEAENIGLGTLWIGYVLDCAKEIQELVNEDKELIAAIAVGYKGQEPNKRPRKPLEEIYKWV